MLFKIFVIMICSFNCIYLPSFNISKIVTPNFFACVFRVPSTGVFKVPTLANIPKKTVAKPSTSSVIQLQNNMKTTSLNDKKEENVIKKPTTDQENNKNMGLTNTKEE